MTVDPQRFVLPVRGRSVILVVVLGVLAGTGGWLVVAERNLDRVQVSWAGPLTCSGTEVVHGRAGAGGSRAQAMRLRQAMDCTLPVRVENFSRFSVQVSRVVLPYMGLGGRVGVRVPELDGRPPLGQASRQAGTDAVFPRGQRVASGERLAFDVRFTFRPSGCTSRGLTTIGPMPAVVVSSLGRTAVRGAGSIGFVGTEDSSCDT